MPPGTLFWLLTSSDAEQSGNRRQPPASDQPLYPRANEIVRSILDDRPPNSTISPTGELYRAIERFHRNIDRVRQHISASSRAATATPPAVPDSSMSSGLDRDRELRRRLNGDPQAEASPLDGVSGLSANPPSLPPLRSLGSRRGSGMSAAGGSSGRTSRYRPSDRYSEGHRPSFENVRSENRSMSTSFEDLSGHLDDANSHLRALLDFTTSSSIIPPLVSPIMSPPLTTQEPLEDNRRAKRRKLDSDKMAPSFRGFRYGRYGQVEPGQLTMEIVSCDGGLYSNESSYAAENMLKNDASVYCTKGNRCNIVLRHQGATVFSLKELIIKAPGSNYSAPVREGMVFIAMNQDDLLQRTAQYQIQYLPTRAQVRRNLEREATRTLPPVYSIRHDEEGNPITRLQSRQRRQYSMSMEDEEDYRTAHIPREFIQFSTSPYNITTECDEDDSDMEGGHAPFGYMRPRRRTPNRIGALPFESDSSDEGNDSWGGDWPVTFEALTQPHEPSRGHRAGSGDDRTLSLAEAQEASQLATQEAVRAVGGELMAPLAHFHIEKDKNKCTIRFDPPVSGRFLLLKMWSPHHDPGANIDIQGVVAKGFAGPRYFPSVDLR